MKIQGLGDKGLWRGFCKQMSAAGGSDRISRAAKDSSGSLKGVRAGVDAAGS